MNIKTTLYLFGALCVLLVGFATLQLLGVLTPDERLERSRFLLPSLNADKQKPLKPSDFSRVVIDRKARDGKPAVQIVLEKQGEEWKMTSPRSVRTDTAAATRLIDQLITAEKEKYANLSTKLGEYGLDDPATVVRLYRGDQETVVNVGDTGPEKDPMVYVTSSDDAKAPQAVKKSRIDKVFASLEDFRDKRLFGSSFDVQAVRIAPAGKSAVEFEKVDNRDWKFREPKLGDADGRAVDELALGVSGIAVDKTTDFVADGPFDDATLAKYGLGKDATSTVTVRRKDPTDPKKMVAETLLIGARDPSVVERGQRLRATALIGETGLPLGIMSAGGALAVREKQDQDLGGYFARLADDNSIVRIDAKHVKLLEKRADDFRSRNLARIDAGKADAINVTSDGETLRFRRPELKVITSKDDKTSARWTDFPHTQEVQFDKFGGQPPFGAPPPGFRMPPPAPAPANWDLYTDTRAKVKTHLDMVPRLIDALNKLELRDGKAFLDDTAKQREWFGMDTIDFGLDKPQAEVWVWLEGIKRDKDGKPEGDGEPKLKDEVKAKPNLKLVIGRKDEKRGVVYVRRQVDDGEQAILAVPDPWISGQEAPALPNQPPMSPRETLSLTEKVTAGYRAFRDHTLPSFTLTNATKVTCDRSGVSYQAEKEEKKDDKGVTLSNWLLKKPVEGKSQNVELLLNLLSTLPADKLLTDRATEKDLKEKFGLADKPLLKATVTVVDKDDKKKSGEYTYIIGKKTEGDAKHVNHFYARMEVKPAEGPVPDANQFVFVLPWYVVQSLDAELRDGTVLEEDKSAKVTEATFTWRKLDKDKKLTETKLDLVPKPEKEGSDKKVWTVQALTVNGKDAKADLPKLDAEKIEQLVGASPASRGVTLRLVPLSTPYFVVHNGKPEAKHRLDPASKDAPPALVIELKYDNKTTKTLTLGDRWEPKEEEYPALAPNAFYYAAASTVPNAVFVLGERDLKPLVDGWEFFKAGEKTAGK